MKKTIQTAAIILFVLGFFASCSTTSKSYKLNGIRMRVARGQLDEMAYNSLKQILLHKQDTGLKDTILIKYDYNDETCWNTLDQREDSHIMGFVTRSNERVKELLARRPNVSVFEFREPGDNLSKIKMWNPSIFIDSSKQLFNLLFKERAICGNSIIVLPDRRFVFIYSDPHSEVLYLTQKQILEILAKK